MAKEKKKKDAKGAEPKLPPKQRVLHEIKSWAWVIAAFLFIHGTIVQARVIPSPSMEETLLVGDHLLVMRFGYDAEVPFTSWHVSLWRQPQRQQVVVFRMAGQPDFIKRIIGLPGDKVEIRDDSVWINGKPLEEPYVTSPMRPDGGVNYRSVTVPPDHYFVMGDNRPNSNDSRYWGFVPRSNIVGTPLVLYMSVEAPEDAWQPGHLNERFLAYVGAIVRPWKVRWKRLFLTF
jgi:signal peptidase I